MRFVFMHSILARYRLFFAALALGLVIRLVLAPLGWHQYDMFTFSDWAWQLYEEPRGRFYAAPLEVPGDHLPGDLTIMWGLAHLTRWLVPGFDFFDPAYAVVLKLVPIVADLLLAAGVLAVARGVTTERRAIMLASVAALNPALVVVSAVWGQWDSVSMALVVWAIALVQRKRTALALPLLAYACLLKPQLGLLIPFLAIAEVRRMLATTGVVTRTAVARLLRDWLAGGVASVALVLAVCLPFGVGLPGMGTRDSLTGRIADAVNRYDGTSMGALNFWYLVFPDVRWDGLTATSGVTYHALGLCLLGVALLVALAGAARIAPWPVGVSWGMTVAMMAVFLLPTRAHERYLVPAVVLSLVLVVIAPGFRWLALGISAASVLNVYLAFSRYHPAVDPAFLQHEAVLRTIALVTLALYGAVVAWGVRAMASDVRWPAWLRRANASFAPRSDPDTT